MPKDFVRKGLYTDSRGRAVINVFDSYRSGYSSGEVVMVEFENVRTHKIYDFEESKFRKKFPYPIDKILVEFSD